MPRWLTDSAVWIGLGLLTVQGLAEFWRVWAVRDPPAKREPLDRER
jgi:hypothetical protein